MFRTLSLRGSYTGSMNSAQLSCVFVPLCRAVPGGCIGRGGRRFRSITKKGLEASWLRVVRSAHHTQSGGPRNPLGAFWGCSGLLPYPFHRIGHAIGLQGLEKTIQQYLVLLAWCCEHVNLQCDYPPPRPHPKSIRSKLLTGSTP